MEWLPDYYNPENLQQTTLMDLKYIILFRTVTPYISGQRNERRTGKAKSTPDSTEWIIPTQ